MKILELLLSPIYRWGPIRINDLLMNLFEMRKGFGGGDVEVISWRVNGS